MRIFLISFILLVISQSCTNPHSKEQEKIIGVKIYNHPGSFDQLTEEWKSIGINTVFVSKKLLADKDFRQEVNKNEITTFVILPIFFDEEALNGNPELFAIKSNGEQAIEEWVKFVCPSNESFRKDKIASIVELVRELNPDGLSIDFIRHFVYWETAFPNTPIDSLPNACFDPGCISKFQEYSGVKLPDSLVATIEKSSWILHSMQDEWTEWKCMLITSMVEEIVQKAKEVKSDILINAHIIPWRQGDYNNAIKSIAGQDVKSISKYTNYISPMTYSHMVKQNAGWVHDVVVDLFQQTRESVLPSIQVKESYLSDTLSSTEFLENLKSALEAPSHGVIFWSWEHIEKDPWKKDIIKRIVENYN